MQQDVHISDRLLALGSETAYTAAEFYDGDDCYGENCNGQTCKFPVTVEYYKEEADDGKKILQDTGYGLGDQILHEIDVIGYSGHEDACFVPGKK